MALESMMGCVVSILALMWSILWRTVENAAGRTSRVLVNVLPACPLGMATNSNLSQYFLRAATRGGVLLGLLRVFLVASDVSGEPNLYEDEGA